MVEDGAVAGLVWTASLSLGGSRWPRVQSGVGDGVEPHCRDGEVEDAMDEAYWVGEAHHVDDAIGLGERCDGQLPSKERMMRE